MPSQPWRSSCVRRSWVQACLGAQGLHFITPLTPLTPPHPASVTYPPLSPSWALPLAHQPLTHYPLTHRRPTCPPTLYSTFSFTQVSDLVNGFEDKMKKAANSGDSNAALQVLLCVRRCMFRVYVNVNIQGRQVKHEGGGVNIQKHIIVRPILPIFNRRLIPTAHPEMLYPPDTNTLPISPEPCSPVQRRATIN